MKTSMPPPLHLCLSIFFFTSLFTPTNTQQAYLANDQLNCSTNPPITMGYTCNTTSSNDSACQSYLIFRSQPPYNTPPQISYLLNSDPSKIASSNNISDVDPIPTGTQVIVPFNCSCFSGKYYQHNSSYTLKQTGETYFIISNNTYQGLTTCQAMITQNPYGVRNLLAGMNLTVPLRCSCPSRGQSAAGFKYLLTYLVTWGDDVTAIAGRFGTSVKDVLDANMLGPNDNIYPFTPLLVPLKTKPTKAEVLVPSPPPGAASPAANSVPADGGKSGKKWIFVGIGVGVGLVALVLIGLLFWCLRRPKTEVVHEKNFEASAMFDELPEKGSETVFSEEVRDVIGSLTVYKYGDLQRATGDFDEEHRIKGSVFRGSINGDYAAIKRMGGDVSNEIKILKNINHSSVIRLSGFCLHEGVTWLVYEYAENGSLSDWIHDTNRKSLGWKQRVHVAYDVADGLNYLHNYTNPPYVHKDLKSSNIVLDGEFKAKIANFGLARSTEDGEEAVHLTRRVVGTQGYMAPEYLEHGLITPKIDAFAYGVVLLELLSGREAATLIVQDGKKHDLLLWESIEGILEGDDVREKLKGFIDPCLKNDYPFELAFAMAQLAMRCVARDPGSRLSVREAFMSISTIQSSSMDWDPSVSESSNSGAEVHNQSPLT